MIQLKPLDNLNVHHPTLGIPLNVNRVFVPSYRCLGEVNLPNGDKGIIDLPTSHALYVPQLLNLRTQDVFCSRTDWPPTLAEELAQPVVRQRNLEVIVNRSVKSAVFLNCIDYVYGHSVNRLLNATVDFNRFKTLDLVILLPNCLRHMIPDGIAEAWIYHGSWVQARSRNQSIEQEFARLYAQVESLYLSPASLTFPEQLDIRAHHFDPADISSETIVYSYREDEPWGGSVYIQKQNIEKLGAAIKKLPEPRELWVQGIGRKAQSAKWENWLVDVVERPTDQDEIRFARRLSKTLVCIGTQGSNLILPSALAWSVVELLSRDKTNHLLGGAYIGKRDVVTQMEAIFRHRTIYGDIFCADISPRLVFAVVYSLIYDRHFLAAYYSRRFTNAREVIDHAAFTAEHMTRWRPPLLTRRDRGWRYVMRRVFSTLDKVARFLRA